MPNLKLVTRIMLPAVLFFASAVGNIVAMGNEKPVFSGEVTDSVSKETLAGANISVITPNDTVWTVSDEKGLFSISVPKADKYWVSAYFVGYTAWKKEYRLPTENIKILLSPSSDKIDEAVLKEVVPVMIEKGDTVVYNLAPIPKMRGDMAGDVIARLPGIEISGDRILALGREVSRVLVNNTSLFGNDNTAAMKNLEAKEVRQVEVYDLVRSSDMDDSARLARACNTLLRTSKGWKGFNTDGFGLEEAVRSVLGRDFKGSDVVVIGAGGAARGAAFHIASCGCKSLLIANRTPERLERLVSDLGESGFKCNAVLLAGCEELIQENSIVINATSVGLRDSDSAVLKFSDLPKSIAFFDMPYIKEGETISVRSARAEGIRACSGLPMLAWQGAKSLSIWTGKPMLGGLMLKTLNGS